MKLAHQSIECVKLSIKMSINTINILIAVWDHDFSPWQNQKDKEEI